MLREHEIKEIIPISFSLIMCNGILTALFCGEKNRAEFAWMLLLLLFLSVAGSFMLRAISFDFNHPMVSEEISLLVGILGVIWVFSMLFLLIALNDFRKIKKYID